MEKDNRTYFIVRYQNYMMDIWCVQNKYAGENFWPQLIIRDEVIVGWIMIPV